MKKLLGILLFATSLCGTNCSNYDDFIADDKKASTFDLVFFSIGGIAVLGIGGTYFYRKWNPSSGGTIPPFGYQTRNSIDYSNDNSMNTNFNIEDEDENEVKTECFNTDGSTITHDDVTTQLQNSLSNLKGAINMKPSQSIMSVNDEDTSPILTSIIPKLQTSRMSTASSHRAFYDEDYSSADNARLELEQLSKIANLDKDYNSDNSIMIDSLTRIQKAVDNDKNVKHDTMPKLTDKELLEKMGILSDDDETMVSNKRDAYINKMEAIAKEDSGKPKKHNKSRKRSLKKKLKNLQ